VKAIFPRTIQCLWSTSLGSPAEAFLPENRGRQGASGAMVRGEMSVFCL